MSGYLSVGLLLAVLGAFFVLMPYEKLHEVFRGMRSPVTTRVGAGVRRGGGAALFLKGVLLLGGEGRAPPGVWVAAVLFG